MDEGTSFLVYVDIKDEIQRAQFAGSGALLTFWYYNNGKKLVQKAQLDAASYENERYWVVGCIGKETGRKDAKDGGLFSTGIQNFFGKAPETELGAGYCNKKINPTIESSSSSGGSSSSSGSFSFESSSSSGSFSFESSSSSSTSSSSSSSSSEKSSLPAKPALKEKLPAKP